MSQNGTFKVMVWRHAGVQYYLYFLQEVFSFINFFTLIYVKPSEYMKMNGFNDMLMGKVWDAHSFVPFTTMNTFTFLY